jgi:hypothetical protein
MFVRAHNLLRSSEDRRAWGWLYTARAGAQQSAARPARSYNHQAAASTPAACVHVNWVNVPRTCACRGYGVHPWFQCTAHTLGPSAWRLLHIGTVRALHTTLAYTTRKGAPLLTQKRGILDHPATWGTLACTVLCTHYRAAALASQTHTSWRRACLKTL